MLPTQATFLVPVGLPVAMFYLLYNERAALKTDGSKARIKYDFLCGGYFPEFYYWVTSRTHAHVRARM